MITFGDFKKLEYSDSTPMEYVLASEFYNGNIDFQTASIAYNRALERERHKKNSLFNEAACVISMILSGNWKGKDKSTLDKRAVHIINLNRTFPKNVYNEKFNYSEEDKKHWDEFCATHYGGDINE